MSRFIFFSVFRFVIAALLLGAQIFLYRQFRQILRSSEKSSPWILKAVSALFILFNIPLLTLIFSPVLYREHATWIIHSIIYPFFVWQSATFFVALVIMIVRFVRWLFDKFATFLRVISRTFFKKERPELNDRSIQRTDQSRRLFLKTGIVGLTAYSIGGVTYKVLNKDQYDIVEKKIHVPNLPPQFKGFTIGLMSDVHSSIFMTKEDMDRYVAGLNGLKTDLIVVPGDFVNSQTEEVYPFAEAFSNLHAPYGVFGCLGNHDYFADVEIVAKEVDGCGVKLLRNDAVQIKKDGAYFNLIGVDDIKRQDIADDYLGRALQNVHNSQPKILLCHRPYFLDQFSNREIDLTLAGHTHGGQIVLAKIDGTFITPAALVSPYVWGLYEKTNSQMYVTRGIGTVGIPFRINCPPELTKITLV
jgi:uncharacterized protein